MLSFHIVNLKSGFKTVALVLS